MTRYPMPEDLDGGDFVNLHARQVRRVRHDEETDPMPQPVGRRSPPIDLIAMVGFCAGRNGDLS